MARSLFICFLPILLSLSLFADATRNNLLPFRKLENNEDDSVILQDAFDQSSFLRLPSESENEIMEVPELVRTPWKRVQSPAETHNRFSAYLGLREGESDSIFRPREGESDSIFRPTEGESDSIFRPTEGESDSISPLRGGESDSIFLGRGGGGRKGLRFGRPGAGCHHQHHRGGEMKSEHHIFTSTEDATSFRNFPREFFPREEKEFRPRAEKEEHKHGKHQRPSESEGSGFEPRERAFERTGRVFPERNHSQFERIGKGFPERKHSHSHGHGQWEWESRNEEGPKHGRHERQEDPAALWMDWLRSLIPRH